MGDDYKPVWNICGLCGCGEGWPLSSSKKFPRCEGCGYGCCKKCRGPSQKCFLCELEEEPVVVDEVGIVPKFVVIGASIVGLSVAKVLGEMGVEVTVYEARPANGPLETFEGAINVFPIQLEGLGRLDPELRKNLEKVSAPAHDFPFVNTKGDPLLDLKFDRIFKAYDLPPYYLTLYRSGLMKALKASVTKLDTVTLVYGKRVSSVENNADGVKAIFEDGSVATGDYLIAADGINSVVRKQRFSKVPPRYIYSCRLGAAEGIVEGSMLDKFGSHQVMLKGHSFLQFKLGQNGNEEAPDTMFAEFYYERDKKKRVTRRIVTDEDQEMMKKQWVEMFKDVDNKGFKIPETVSRMKSGTLATFALHEHKKLKTWCENRIVLMGDSAHACSNGAGHGANVGMEDAMVLGDLIQLCVAKHGWSDKTMTKIFELFDRRRIDRAEFVTKNSRLLAQVSMIKNPIVVWLVEKGYRFVTNKEKGPNASRKRFPVMDALIGAYRITSSKKLLLEANSKKGHADCMQAPQK